METGSWISFISGMVGTILTILFFWFTVIGGLRKSISNNTSRIGVLEERTKNCSSCQKDYADLSLKMGLFWESIKPALLKVIHSPTHPRRDYLSEIFLENRRELTIEELKEYRGLLTEAIRENHETGKVLSFSLVAAMVDTELVKKPWELKRSKDGLCRTL